MAKCVVKICKYYIVHNIIEMTVLFNSICLIFEVWPTRRSVSNNCQYGKYGYHNYCISLTETGTKTNNGKKTDPFFFSFLLPVLSFARIIEVRSNDETSVLIKMHKPNKKKKKKKRPFKSVGPSLRREPIVK